MNRWFRVYDDLVDDPKVQRLPDALFKAVINLWCLTSKNNGVLPGVDEVAFKLRMKPEKVEATLRKLREVGLIVDDESGTHPHNWDKRQFRSDVTDPTAAERMRRYRNKDRNELRNDVVSVTVPIAETETEKDKTADAVSKFEFSGGIIKLTAKHLSQWKTAYSNLDLLSELTARDAWLGSDRASDQDRRNWFISTSKYLANRNMEARAKAQPYKTRSGLEGVV